MSRTFKVRAYCGRSRVSDQQPREEALSMDPAFLEKHEASKTMMCAVRGQELLGRVTGSKNPVNPGNEVPVEAGRSVGMEEQ